MRYGRRRLTRKFGRRMSARRPSLAKKAYRLAKRIAAHSEETKFFRRGVAADVNNGAVSKFAIFEQLTATTNNDTVLFSNDYSAKGEKILGNKYFHKRTQVRWEIHMDNINNEEETCNFTVAVIQPKKDADTEIQTANNEAAAMSKFTDVYQGQAFFDTRFVKIHYYKHFTLTMGGTAPGTSGEMLKKGIFKKSLNKMMRRWYDTSFDSTLGVPIDYQSRLYFVVLTDNAAIDTESPRINYSVVNTIKDTDLRNLVN